MSKCKHIHVLADYERNTMVCADCDTDVYEELKQERDELQGQVVALRGALERVSKVSRSNGLFPLTRITREAVKGLAYTPSEAAERVQKLVEALEEVCEEFHDVETDLCTSIQIMYEKAQKALSEWRDNQ